MHDLKGTISKGGAAGGAAPAGVDADADALAASGVESPEPGVFRCKECGATSNTVTGAVTGAFRWVVKGCTCDPARDPARSFGVPKGMTGGDAGP